MNKLLTVTVPCYNSEAFMRKCIDSLLTGRDDRIEVIIVDDGSTDNTGGIADKYAKDFPGIVRVVHQPNGGHGEGINAGLLRATGTFFKVVDSDDWVSESLPDFLAYLEKIESEGGADLVVTNYYYEHADQRKCRSLGYANILPEGRVFTWSEAKTFHIYQLLTIHCCTFKTEIMKKSGFVLPKHVFYEDNLMIHLLVPFVHRMAYLNTDLYHYYIGRPDQSVQKLSMMKRYKDQIAVTVDCFTSSHLGEISNVKQNLYMRHELYMMFAISILFTRMNCNKLADADVKQMWADCEAFDKHSSRHFRYHTTLVFIGIPGCFGWLACKIVYRIADAIVPFN